MKPATGALIFYPLALLVGAACALLVAGIDLLVALVHNLAFLGRLSLSYDPSLHTPPGAWGPFTALVPALGALAVATLARKVAREVEGPGVAQVLEATTGRRPVIRPRVLGLKPVAVALSIGTGASVGREGPMVHAAAALGGGLSRLLHLPPWQRAALLACAAGAAIAAAYGTALGGVLFAVEILLAEVSVRTVVPTLLAAATGAAVSRFLLGPRAVLVLPAHVAGATAVSSLPDLLPYLLVGALVGAASAAFILLPTLGDRLLQRGLGRNPWLRSSLAMLAAGGLFVLLRRLTGHYYVEGLGYATIEDVLSGELTAPFFLLLLAALKLLVTALALGSGAAGGVFTPSLYLGATLGGALALLLGVYFPALAARAPELALAGMAGMVAGTTGAPLMAILMVLEITGRVSLAVPLGLSVALSYGVRKALLRESAYTLRLARAGQLLPDARVFGWVPGELASGEEPPEEEKPPE